VFKKTHRRSGSARFFEALFGLRTRLILLIILAVALPTLLFLRHAGMEQRSLVVGAEHRILRLTRSWADHEHDLAQEARLLVESLAERSIAEAGPSGLCDALKSFGRRRDAGILGLSVILPDGQVACSQNAPSLPAQALDRWSFLNDLQEFRGFQVSDFVPRSGSLEPTYYAGMAVGAASEIVVALDLDWIDKLAERDAEGIPYDAMVVDRAGMILMHHATGSSLSGLRLANHPLMPRLMIEPEGTTIGAGPDGVERIYAFAQMPETGTKLILGIARSDLLGPEIEAVNSTLLALGVVAILAVLMGAIGAELLVFRWINAMARAARAIGTGGLDKPLRISRGAGELGVLASAFNQMSADLVAQEEGRRTATEAVEAKGRELAESEKRFRDIAEVTGDWFWELDAELHCVYLSGQFSTVTQIPAATLLGKPLDGLAEIGMTRESLATLRAACASQRRFRGIVCSVQTAPGLYRYWQLNGKPIFDAAGRFDGFRGSGADITAVKHAEQALIEAKSVAEAADLSKSEFLANMSHELRTPLNAVIGFADLMQAEALGPIGGYRDYAKDIADSGRHLLDLINDILDMSKIEAGVVPLAEEMIDLADTIGTCLRMVVARAESAGVGLSCTLSPSVRTLRADPRRFCQILLNLLSNAVKFTPPGGSVTLSTTLDPTGEFVVQIKDTGVGIAEADIAKVMQPFGQADGGLNRRHDGTGLGLPITRRLVELHGGSLILHSKLEAGTLVTIVFPAERVIAAAA